MHQAKALIAQAIGRALQHDPVAGSPERRCRRRFEQAARRSSRGPPSATTRTGKSVPCASRSPHPRGTANPSLLLSSRVTRGIPNPRSTRWDPRVSALPA